MPRSFIFVLAILLVACATPTWHHPSKSTQEFYRDNSQCMAMAGAGQSNQIVYNSNPVLQGYNQGSAMGAAANRQAIHEQCMYGNGWYLSRDVPSRTRPTGTCDQWGNPKDVNGNPCRQ